MLAPHFLSSNRAPSPSLHLSISLSLSFPLSPSLPLFSLSLHPPLFPHVWDLSAGLVLDRLRGLFPEARPGHDLAKLLNLLDFQERIVQGGALGILHQLNRGLKRVLGHSPER